MEDTLQNYAKKIAHDYCLMIDKNGFLQPYDISQQMLLSWDYLHTHSRIKEDSEVFKAYMKRRLTVCANTVFAPTKPEYVSFNQTQYLNTFKVFARSKSLPKIIALFNVLAPRLPPATKTIFFNGSNLKY